MRPVLSFGTVLLAACRHDGTPPESALDPDYVARLVLPSAKPGNASFYDAHDLAPTPQPALDSCVPFSAEVSSGWVDDPGAIQFTRNGSVLASDGGTLLDRRWDPGAEMGLAVSGGDVPEFWVEPAITLPDAVDAAITVDADGSLTATWTPGLDTDRVVLWLPLTNGFLNCLARDDGAFTVSAGDLYAPLRPGTASIARLRQRISFSADGRVRIEAEAYAFLDPPAILE
ncbi:MAG: hypothetical protein R3F59_20910 [Myxococcota bacterium]